MKPTRVSKKKDKKQRIITSVWRKNWLNEEETAAGWGANIGGSYALERELSGQRWWLGFKSLQQFNPYWSVAERGVGYDIGGN